MWSVDCGVWSENTTEIKYSYTKSLVLESISHSTLLTPHFSTTVAWATVEKSTLPVNPASHP